MGYVKLFTFCNADRDAGYADYPPQIQVDFTARNGVITEAEIGADSSNQESGDNSRRLIGQKLIEIEDWDRIVGDTAGLNEIFPPS